MATATASSAQIAMTVWASMANTPSWRCFPAGCGEAPCPLWRTGKSGRGYLGFLFASGLPSTCPVLHIASCWIICTVFGVFFPSWYHEQSFACVRGRQGFGGAGLFEKLSSVFDVFKASLAQRRPSGERLGTPRAAGFRSPGCIGPPAGHAPAAEPPARRCRGAHACCASDGAAAVPRIPQEAQAFQPSQTRGRVRARGAAGGRLRDRRLRAVVFLGA